MRPSAWLNRRLSRYDVKVTHYSYSHEARRNTLLTHLGIQDLIDVGANTGQYGLGMRNHGYAGRLWSFEPLIAAYESLARTAENDPYWQAHRLALGSEQGELTLQISEESIFSSPATLREGAVDGFGNRPNARVVGQETAPVDTLDAVVPTLEGLTGPLGVKIDVQGYEAPVFDGGAEILARADYLEFEMSMTELYEGQELFPDMLERARRLGFVLALTEPCWVLPTGQALQLNGVFVKQA